MTTRQKIAKSLDDGPLGVAVIVIIVLYLISLTLETLPSLEEHKSIFQTLENVFTGIFICELVVRLIVYAKPLKYVFSFFGIVDIVSIVPALFGTNLMAVRVFRLLRIFKLFRSKQMNQAVTRISNALLEVRTDLLLFCSIVLILLYFSAVGIYLFENEAQPEIFSSIPAAMWWAVATLTTVGYGDAYPITTGGKIFTSIVTILGIGIIAIPTGLIAAALTSSKNKDDSD
jgi:voltage-gated potassium channel|tara:strand:- start:241 stop:930 length:690 start_codon:yes stop_codon:yes gene_type:complete